MSEVLTPLVYQLGVGGIGGLIIGFTLKKISKIFIMIIGIFLIALIYLGTQNIISINYTALFDALQKSILLVNPAINWVIGLVSLLPFAGSFVAGFFIGFKLG